MTCSNYQLLTIPERVEMVGRIVHALQSDNDIFTKVEALIKKAETKGLYEGVTINPSQPQKDISISDS